MKKQMNLSELRDELAQVQTKKEFLKIMDRIIPWDKWIALIRSCYYYKGESGNKPYDLELMLRIYLLQNFYNLSDMATVA